jgi:cytosine/adenosine deaminase-related metal-dependent hydrolase
MRYPYVVHETRVAVLPNGTTRLVTVRAYDDQVEEKFAAELAQLGARWAHLEDIMAALETGS